jgi:hypothetical protein
VRVAAYLLVAANILYLAWAGWIDVPPPAAPVQVTEQLPQLVLATEDVSRSADAPESVGTPAVATAAVLASATNTAPASKCVSVGPFTELTQAARAAALLRDRGFEPRQRAEPGEMWEGFWVYVDLATAADESKLIKALERAGITDAQPMPGGERRVSVGLFSERERADRRAQAVKRLGYSPDIAERRQAGTVYWVDLDVGSPERSIPTEGLLSLENAGARLEVRVCPSVEREQDRPEPGEVRPAATTADARRPRSS